MKGRAPAQPWSRISRAASGILLGTALAMAPRMARAEEPARAKGAEEPAPAKGAAAPSPENAEEPVPAKAGEGGPLNALAGESKAGTPHHKDAPGAIFGRLALGASYDKPALAGGAGLRYQFSKPWMVGIDAELNPWIASPPTRVRAGALNTYATLIRRFQLKSDSVNIRTTAALGASFLLIDLVGAPRGSVGPFFGLSFLGVEWKVAPGFFLTVDPSYIVFPVPHLTGVPFGYMQYRFQLGLEFGG